MQRENMLEKSTFEWDFWEFKHLSRSKWVRVVSRERETQKEIKLVIGVIWVIWWLNFEQFILPPPTYSLSCIVSTIIVIRESTEFLPWRLFLNPRFFLHFLLLLHFPTLHPRIIVLCCFLLINFCHTHKWHTEYEKARETLVPLISSFFLTPEWIATQLK